MNFKELGARLGLEEDEYRELIELFVESGGADYERLQAAVASNDLEQIARSAHTIKGAAGNLGLMDVHAVAREIEETAANTQKDALDRALETLGTQFQAIADFVRTA
jgi:HPt (histidine-containing phosphotransfer) domain-containing protein